MTLMYIIICTLEIPNFHFISFSFRFFSLAIDLRESIRIARNSSRRKLCVCVYVSLRVSQAISKIVEQVRNSCPMARLLLFISGW